MICTPQSLITAASLFFNSPLSSIQVYLLAQIAGVPADPQALAKAAEQFQSLSARQLSEIQACLLCQIVNAIPEGDADAPILREESTVPFDPLCPVSLFAKNIVQDQFPVNLPEKENWEFYSSPTLIGNPTTDPGEWFIQDLGAMSSGGGEIAVCAQSVNWIARYRSGGVYSPWSNKVGAPQGPVNPD